MTARWQLRCGRGDEARASFLKKSSKKLLILLASALPDKASPISQKFFGSFFQTRTFFVRRFACSNYRQPRCAWL
jgi:hypothetical protein